MSSLLPARYALDLTGDSLDNLVENEPHALGTKRYRPIALLHAPFFKKNVRVVDDRTNQVLTPNQFRCMNLVALPSAMAGMGNEVYAILVVTDPSVSPNVLVSYHTVGGAYTRSYEPTKAMLETLLADNRPARWPNVLDRAEGFEPSLHLHAVGDAIGWEYVAVALEDLRSTIFMGDTVGQDQLLTYLDDQIAQLTALVSQSIGETSALSQHIAAHTNVHQVTAAQLGLDKVRNYPVASEEEAIDGSLTNRYMTPSLVTKVLEARATTNPFNLTKADVGLPLVENYPVASVAEVAAPQESSPRYVTNLALKQHLQESYSALLPSLQAEVTAVKTASNAALVAAQASARTSDEALQTITTLRSDSQAALTQVQASATLAVLVNSKVAASEALAVTLLQDYISEEGAGAQCAILIEAARVAALEEGRLAGYTAGYNAGVANGGAAPANGTLLSSACVGVNNVGTYANGTGGSYTQVITANSPACGYVAPGGGTIPLDATFTVSVVNYAGFNEGMQANFKVGSTNVVDGTVVYAIVSGTNVTAADFAENALTQPVTINNNTATFSLMIQNDLLAEGVETMSVKISPTAAGNSQLATTGSLSINDTSHPPAQTCVITSDKESVNEGESVTFTITTTNVPNGTTLTYQLLNGYSVDAYAIDAADFGIPLTDTFTQINNVSTLVVPIAVNQVVDGANIKWYQRENQESFSIGISGGALPAPPAPGNYYKSVTIVQPEAERTTATITADKTTTYEGDTVTFTVNAVNVYGNSEHYWRIVSSTMTGADFVNGVTSGLVSMGPDGGNVTAYISLTLAEDAINETGNTFTIELHKTEVAGTVLATSEVITVAAP